MQSTWRHAVACSCDGDKDADDAHVKSFFAVMERAGLEGCSRFFDSACHRHRAAFLPSLNELDPVVACVLPAVQPPSLGTLPD